MASRASSLPVEIGRYQIVRLHGQGAMGRVLLAHDPVLDRDVAVKLLRDDLTIPDDQRQALLDRMRQEARAAARVSHPNIVALHDMGEDADLGLYLVFEYLPGSTLKERLERGPLGPAGASRLATELGAALTTAHEAGVLHRDIKPENIILTPTGAKIADFGIARVPDSTLTLGGVLLGTPAYSAPEALSGGQFSARSDQFSMAATLYEAISGRRAFPGEDAVAVASKIASDDAPPVSDVAGVEPAVDGVLARALSRDPRARFETCAEFGTALADALRAGPRAAMQTLPDEVHRAVSPDATGLRVARAATGGIAVGAMLAIFGFQLTAHLRQDDSHGSSQPVAQAATPKPIEAEPVAWLAERPKPPKPVPLPPHASAHASDKARPPHGKDDHAADALRFQGWRADGGAAMGSPSNNPASDGGVARRPR
jgi:serine/threonine-protein kinase